MNAFQKFFQLFSKPTAFFKSIEKDNSYWEILKTNVIVSIPFTLLGFIISIIVSSLLVVGYPSKTDLIYFIFVALLTTIMLFANPFINSAIYHLFVMIVGGKKGYLNTFKSWTYCSLIMQPYSIFSIFFLSVAYALMRLPLLGLNIGRSPLLDFSHAQSSILLNLILFAVISLIGFIHMIIVLTKAVSTFQNISLFRAYLATLIFPLCVLVLLMFFFFVIIMLFFGIATTHYL